MRGIIGLLASGLLAVAAPATAEPYSWQLYQTSLFDLNGGAPDFTPGVVGLLILDETAVERGGVEFFAESAGEFQGYGPPFDTPYDDTDFDFSVGNVRMPDLAGSVVRASFFLTVAGDRLDGAIDFHSIEDEITEWRIVDNQITGVVGSDGLLMGCGYSQCAITGMFVPVGDGGADVPEPPTLALVGAGFFVLLGRLTRKPHPLIRPRPI